MRKFFARIVALLLVPCLIADPVTAMGLHDTVTCAAPAVSPISSSRIQEEALTTALVFAHLPLLHEAVKALKPIVHLALQDHPAGVLHGHAVGAAALLMSVSLGMLGMALSRNRNPQNPRQIFTPERAKDLYDGLQKEFQAQVIEKNEDYSFFDLRIKRSSRKLSYELQIMLIDQTLFVGELVNRKYARQIEFVLSKTTLQRVGARDYFYSGPYPFVGFVPGPGNEFQIEVKHDFYNDLLQNKELAPHFMDLFVPEGIHEEGTYEITLEPLGSLDLATGHIELPTYSRTLKTENGLEDVPPSIDQLDEYDRNPNHPYHFFPRVIGFLKYLRQDRNPWLHLLLAWTDKPFKIVIIRGEFEDIAFHLIDDAYVLMVPFELIPQSDSNYPLFVQNLKERAASRIMNYFDTHEPRGGGGFVWKSLPLMMILGAVGLGVWAALHGSPTLTAPVELAGWSPATLLFMLSGAVGMAVAKGLGNKTTVLSPVRDMARRLLKDAREGSMTYEGAVNVLLSTLNVSVRNVYNLAAMAYSKPATLTNMKPQLHYYRQLPGPVRREVDTAAPWTDRNVENAYTSTREVLSWVRLGLLHPKHGIQILLSGLGAANPDIRKLTNSLPAQPRWQSGYTIPDIANVFRDAKRSPASSATRNRAAQPPYETFYFNYDGHSTYEGKKRKKARTKHYPATMTTSGKKEKTPDVRLVAAFDSAGKLTMRYSNGAIQLTPPEEERLRAALENAAAAQKIISKEIPLRINYDVKHVAQHERFGIYINRAIPQDPLVGAETPQERQLFIDGAIWHDVYHWLHPDEEESQVQNATLKYFKTRPDILAASIRVLEPSVQNGVEGQEWLVTLKIAEALLMIEHKEFSKGVAQLQALLDEDRITTTFQLEGVRRGFHDASTLNEDPRLKLALFHKLLELCLRFTKKKDSVQLTRFTFVQICFEEALTYRDLGEAENAVLVANSGLETLEVFRKAHQKKREQVWWTDTSHNPATLAPQVRSTGDTSVEDRVKEMYIKLNWVSRVMYLRSVEFGDDQSLLRDAATGLRNLQKSMPDYAAWVADEMWASALANLGVALCTLGQDEKDSGIREERLREADQLAARVMKDYSAFPESFYLKGVLAAERENPREAIDALTSAWKLKPELRTAAQLASVYYQLEDYPSVEHWLKQIPSTQYAWRSWLALGQGYFNHRQYQDALNAWDILLNDKFMSLVAKKQNIDSFCRNIIQAYLYLKQTTKAVEMLKSIIQNHWEDDRAGLAKILLDVWPVHDYETLTQLFFDLQPDKLTGEVVQQMQRQLGASKPSAEVDAKKRALEAYFQRLETKKLDNARQRWQRDAEELLANESKLKGFFNQKVWKDLPPDDQAALLAEWVPQVLADAKGHQVMLTIFNKIQVLLHGSLPEVALEHLQQAIARSKDENAPEGQAAMANIRKHLKNQPRLLMQVDELAGLIAETLARAQENARWEKVMKGMTEGIEALEKLPLEQFYDPASAATLRPRLEAIQGDLKQAVPPEKRPELEKRLSDLQERLTTLLKRLAKGEETVAEWKRTLEEIANLKDAKGDTRWIELSEAIKMWRSATPAVEREALMGYYDRVVKELDAARQRIQDAEERVKVAAALDLIKQCKTPYDLALHLKKAYNLLSLRNAALLAQAHLDELDLYRIGTRIKEMKNLNEERQRAAIKNAIEEIRKQKGFSILELSVAFGVLLALGAAASLFLKPHAFVQLTTLSGAVMGLVTLGGDRTSKVFCQARQRTFRLLRNVLDRLVKKEPLGWWTNRESWMKQN